jgi:y4mF family transcriptional regulator
MFDFSGVVRFHRKRAGLTQLQLADLAGVGKTVVFDIESGKETVRLATLVQVLAALNIRLEWTSPLKQAYLESEREAR